VAGDTPLEHWKIPADMHIILDMKVADYTVNGDWSIPKIFHNRDMALVNKRVNYTPLPSKMLEIHSPPLLC